MAGDDPAKVLAELAEKLSFEKLLIDNPDLTIARVRQILLEAARAMAKKSESVQKHSGDKDDNLFVINVDGGSRGNPGPAGLGVVIRRGSEKIELKRFIGKTTNNVAEYEALIVALKESVTLGAKRVEIRTDSELMAHQMNGVYRVKAENLIPYFQKAKELANKFDQFTIRHVDRSQNKDADRLANEAMDEGI